MDDREQFKRSLLRILQSGTFKDLLDVPDGQCTTVAFHLERVYRVRVAPRRIFLTEQDREYILRWKRGRWRATVPIVLDRGRVVIDRCSGAILESAVGRMRRSRRSSRKTPRALCRVYLIKPTSRG